MSRRAKCAVPAVVHDRYSATGTPRPGPNACKRCDGMGYHPTRCSCRGTQSMHTADEMEDWCWVSPCQTCKGTRLQLS